MLVKRDLLKSLLTATYTTQLSELPVAKSLWEEPEPFSTP
jgi:hypothetical protein